MNAVPSANSSLPTMEARRRRLRDFGGTQMQGLKVGVHILAGQAKGLVEGIVAAEAAGIEVAWMTSGGVAADPLAVFSAADAPRELVVGEALEVA